MAFDHLRDPLQPGFQVRLESRLDVVDVGRGILAD